MIRPMEGEDFVWAAQLMERRRQVYERFSPVFWRPAEGITDSHAEFLRATGHRDGAVALRSDHGFVLAYPHEGRCFVDDFAVHGDDYWASEGRSLLLATWEASRASGLPVLRAVTARDDLPKREMLTGLGLTVTARWWVKALTPTSTTFEWGPVRLGDVDALVMPAPPVYDPGGPVCLLGDIASSDAATAADAAADTGAVLAIVQRDRSPMSAPEEEHDLEAAGFHNPSEFYEGIPG